MNGVIISKQETAMHATLLVGFLIALIWSLDMQKTALYDRLTHEHSGILSSQRYGSPTKGVKKTNMRLHEKSELLSWKTIDAFSGKHKLEAPSKREGHSLTKLYDYNFAFLFGGCYLDVTCYDDLYLLDLHSKEWSIPEIAGTPPRPRGGHSAVSTSHGLVIFGGDDLDEFFNDLSILDWKKQQWVVVQISARVSPSPRRSHGSAAIGNQIFIFGGYTKNGYTSDLWVFDVIWHSWNKVISSGEIPSPRSGHSLTAIGDHHLLLFGGMSDSQVFGDLYLLDIRFFSWVKLRTTGVQPPPIQGHAVDVLKDSMFLVGGCNAYEGICYSSTWVLQAALTGPSWMRFDRLNETSFGYPRGGHAIVVHEGSIFCFGGCSESRKCFHDLKILNTRKEQKKSKKKRNLKLKRATPINIEGSKKSTLSILENEKEIVHASHLEKSNKFKNLQDSLSIRTENIAWIAFCVLAIPLFVLIGYIFRMTCIQQSRPKLHDILRT